ncbi:MAG: FAD-dependent thymidylate synthase [Candidatus Nanoarchaeia archaeon]|nr:FAD-dependent thymidylate synthase [Candidatus Nanoarchaeia archaeon]
MGQRRIYTLSGMPEEVIAVAFAKCSRDPRPFDEIAKELDADKSRKFHEQWVVGYGHGSVAEHAVAHLALENVSILATKVIEDNRLASYTEKSTRYQVFEAGKCHRDENISQSRHSQLYEDTVKVLFDAYADCYAKVSDLMRQRFPKGDAEKETMYEQKIKARTCDVVRYILPAGTYTQLGLTMNARSLEYCISKLLTHPLKEMNEIGAEMKTEALKELPTLVKYANEISFVRETREKLESIAVKELASLKPLASGTVRLARFDPFATRRVLAAMLYRASKGIDYESIQKHVDSMQWQERNAIIEEIMKNRGPHDKAPREFEEALYTFDILLDYGAYRDIQRHRIAEQVCQNFSTLHGFSMPSEIEEVGMKDVYENAMAKADDAYKQISLDFPFEAQYIVPLAYKIRLLMTMDLREVFHFTELRSKKQGHISYRRVAQEMADEVMKVHPELGKYLRIDRS